jgi:hypothetical protein
MEYLSDVSASVAAVVRKWYATYDLSPVQGYFAPKQSNVAHSFRICVSVGFWLDCGQAASTARVASFAFFTT